MSHTEVSLCNILMVTRSQNRLIFSFKQLSCLQTIFITCDVLFGFELFVLVSGRLTKYPKLDLCATNVQLLSRNEFISLVTNYQYVSDPINKGHLKDILRKNAFPIKLVDSWIKTFFNKKFLHTPLALTVEKKELPYHILVIYLLL